MSIAHVNCFLTGPTQTHRQPPLRYQVRVLLPRLR
jgi:hypothetical protein